MKLVFTGKLLLLLTRCFKLYRNLGFHKRIHYFRQSIAAKWYVV